MFNFAPISTGFRNASVFDGQTAALTIRFWDPEDDSVTFTLGGDDGHLFSVDPATNLMAFNLPPEFANPSDANGDNVYELTLTLTDDKGASSTTDLRVGVSNFALPYPDAPAPSQYETVTVANAPNSNVRARSDDHSAWLQGKDGVNDITGSNKGDFIAPGAGIDGQIFGRGGADIFALYPGDNLNRIQDFEDGIDKILLGGGFSFDELQISFFAAAGTTATKLKTPSGDAITLVGISADQITEADIYTSSDAPSGNLAPYFTIPQFEGGNPKVGDYYDGNGFEENTDINDASFRLSARDPEGGALSFSIIGGADADLFTLSETYRVGDITFVDLGFSTPLDYEARIAAGETVSPSVNLEVTDGFGARDVTTYIGRITNEYGETQIGTAVDDFYSVPADTALILGGANSVLANDIFETSVSPLSRFYDFEVIYQPLNGSLSFDKIFETTDLLYTPDPGFVGQDGFIYAIKNNDATLDTGFVTIDVGGGIPPIDGPDVTVDGEDFAEVMIVGYSDANAPTDNGGDMITNGNDSIRGNGGDDNIRAGAGDDTIEGGDGRDRIKGDNGDDIVKGNNGHDILAGINGDDTIDGGDGNDFILGGAGADVLNGNNDRDNIRINKVADADGDVVDGGAGGNDSDKLDLRGTGLVRVVSQSVDSNGNGTDGVLEIVNAAGVTQATVTYAEIETLLVDGYFTDPVTGPTLSIAAKAGEPTDGSGNPETAENGAPVSIVISRDGPTDQPLLVTLTSSDTGEATVPSSVTIPAGASSAEALVTPVDDALVDDTQLPVITASASGATSGSTQVAILDDDTAGPGPTGPVVDGTSGNDVMKLGIYVDPQGDLITQGDDLIFGNDGNDTIDAGAGNDTIFGGDGDDDIFGSGGDDVINSGSANRFDDVWLDGGSDTLVFEQNGGVERVRKFGIDDKVDLSSYGFDALSDVDYATSSNGRHTNIDLGNGDLIALFSITADQLDSDNFIL